MVVHHTNIHHYRSPPAIVMKVVVPEDKIVPFTQKLRDEYIKLYNSQVIKPSILPTITIEVDKIREGKPRYVNVSIRTGVPWYVVGIIHFLECGGSFTEHLHNGDPLSAKTVHSPVGRPSGNSWTWEDSAVDALHIDGFLNWKDWSVAGILFRLESYNGFGSRNHGVATPYLWSGTQFYTKGKYGSDGKWDPELVSKQVGAAPLLKGLNGTL